MDSRVFKQHSNSYWRVSLVNDSLSNVTSLQNWRDFYTSRILNFWAPIHTSRHLSGGNLAQDWTYGVLFCTKFYLDRRIVQNWINLEFGLPYPPLHRSTGNLVCESEPMERNTALNVALFGCMMATNPNISRIFKFNILSWVAQRKSWTRAQLHTFCYPMTSKTCLNYNGDSVITNLIVQQYNGCGTNETRATYSSPSAACAAQVTPTVLIENVRTACASP